MSRFDPNDDGLLSGAEASLLVDQYELTMAATYHRERLDEDAVFELFVRTLPPERDWLVAAGIGPALRILREIRFGDRELAFLRDRGFEDGFLERLAEWVFDLDVDGMPEGTVCFAGEPLVRVTGPLIEAQIIETILLNQVNFQTMAATKAARVTLAAGGGRPGAGGRVIDFSPRRDHGVDAAMKIARAAAIAGCGGTSNMAAAMRYGLTPVGTMAHSFVLSFERERDAFAAFLRAFPDEATLLVDTYDTAEGTENAIAAARDTGIALRGIRIDSGDFALEARSARAALDAGGFAAAEITVSGDLEERRIAALVADGAPIDRFGVGTDLGTSRDSPTVGGVYKLVARRRPGAPWAGVAKRSPGKATLPGAKQVWRTYGGGEMTGDLVAPLGSSGDGEPLLTTITLGLEGTNDDTLDSMRRRCEAGLAALPERLRGPATPAGTEPYPVAFADSLRNPPGAPSV